jgi:pyruvate formate lyase activating enzyme
MNIAGLQKTSLIDYPGKISAVIFTSGCNFNCHFCHNPELVNPQLNSFQIKEKEIFEFLDKRKKIVDAVVISGGEPTIYEDLIEFIKKLEKQKFLIKLDTNGSNPETIKALLKEKLLDCIAMDIKGPIEKYDIITGKNVNKENIKKSVEIIKSSKVDYEFRTTVIPKYLVSEDFKQIGEWLKGAKKYYLQQFRNSKTLDPDFKNIAPYSEEDLQKFARIMRKYVSEVGIRGM